MALRIPRGYAVNRPYFREVSEGVRPNSQAAPRLPFTGLPHVRVDEVHHDPIVIDAGTLIGAVTGPTGAIAPYTTTITGYFGPAFIGGGAVVLTGIQGQATTGTPDSSDGQGSAVGGSAAAQYLKVIGSTEGASTWGLWGATSGNIALGAILPIGVVSQPVYSSYLPTAFTNYKRQHSTPILTDYVIQIPATNDEEVLIDANQKVMLGSGTHYGIGCTDPYSTQKQAGRYARFAPEATRAMERVVGVCLKRTYLGQGGSSTSTGDRLADKLSDFTASSDLAAEFAGLERVQTVPGLTLSGAETKGVPTFLLGARADGRKRYYALTILIRI